MADARRFADVESMRPVVCAVLTMDDGGTTLVYAWDDSEDYWQGARKA
jgi:hypothetical protein